MENEIEQYQMQLRQVQLAMSELPECPAKENLLTLETDLKEIISLSQNNWYASRAEENQAQKEDTLSQQCDEFKAELEKLSTSRVENESKNQKLENISFLGAKPTCLKEFNELQGAKCQAPFAYKWTDRVTYHNAVITKVPSALEVNDYDNTKVKVMFTNPTHKEMLPCPYYLDGYCKFTDGDCKYSHGELVQLNLLKRYREPNFSGLSKGCHVFAKQNDGLWQRAIVINIIENNCHVRFECNSKEISVPLHNVYPLDVPVCKKSLSNVKTNFDCGHNNISGVTGNDDGDEDAIEHSAFQSQDGIFNRILTNPPGSVLGEWEQYTKGIGSKIMSKMGYIHGSGLGKNGLGRVEPISVTVFPPGKSLDHCMMIKGKAGEGENLFKAERKMKMMQKKHEEKLKMAYAKEKKQGDLFTFLNTKLHCRDKELNKVSPPLNTKLGKDLVNESTRNLNLTSLQLSEKIRQLEKEIKSLNQSLKRHSAQGHAYNVLKDKLASKISRLSQLQASEAIIKNEQSHRRDRRKLTVF